MSMKNTVYILISVCFCLDTDLSIYRLKYIHTYVSIWIVEVLAQLHLDETIYFFDFIMIKWQKLPYEISIKILYVNNF